MRRGAATGEPRRSRRGTKAKAEPKAVGKASPADPLIDDEMAEIQAILKKRGIS